MTERAPSPHLRIVSVQSPQSMEAGMKQDERHHTSDDIFVGIDLATRQHQVVVLDARGQRLTSFKVPHSRAGLHELVERCTSRRARREHGQVHFAFEATGHVCTSPADHRQAAQLRRGPPHGHAVRGPSHRAVREQSGGGLASADSPTRGPDARLQICGARAAILTRARPRAEPLSGWAGICCGRSTTAC